MNNTMLICGGGTATATVDAASVTLQVVSGESCVGKLAAS